MDEVKTGFRVGMTGAQGYYGVSPDLTTMGKIVGAGFPIGVLGGRKYIMEMAAPAGSDGTNWENSKRTPTDILYHSGTYNGHPAILALGVETINILKDEMTPLIERTEYFKKEIKEIFAKHGVKILTPGVGAAFNICVTDQNEILSYRDLKKCDFDLRRRIDYALMLDGVYCKPCARYYLSTAHTREVIDFTLDKYEKVWGRI
jgi:glutamate-1-semialdehyde 2,1-aminomutase